MQRRLTLLIISLYALFLLGSVSVNAANNSFYSLHVDNKQKKKKIKKVVDRFLVSQKFLENADRLHIYVDKSKKIKRECTFSGRSFQACYKRGGRLYFPQGYVYRNSGWQYLLAHEFAHFLADYSFNDPWDAFSRGTKRWGTYNRICQKVRAGQLYPGNEGKHYYQNPGEIFADTYSYLIYPKKERGFYERNWPWKIKRPDKRSLQLLKEDIKNPFKIKRQVYSSENYQQVEFKMLAGELEINSLREVVLYKGNQEVERGTSISLQTCGGNYRLEIPSSLLNYNVEVIQR